MSYNKAHQLMGFDALKTDFTSFQLTEWISSSSFLVKTQNQIDLLKSNYELNHPDKKEKNGFVQISKNNKIISLEDLQIGDEIQLQTPKYIGSCILNKLEKQ